MQTIYCAILLDIKRDEYQIPKSRTIVLSKIRVQVLTGSMFWGSLLSSALVGGFVGVIVFVFVWQVGSFVEEMSKLSPRSGQISSLTLLFDSL